MMISKQRRFAVMQEIVLNNRKNGMLMLFCFIGLYLLAIAAIIFGGAVGGGALVLETEEHALARGAKILAELKGCGNTCDAHHVTAPHPEGRGAIACMKLALADAGLDASDIGYVNAHGTATHKGDTVETNAIKTLFGDKLPIVSSTKGATGHMMGAGGVTETITCIKESFLRQST